MQEETSGDIVTFRPGETAELFESGQMNVVTKASAEVDHAKNKALLEYAENLFGEENVIGADTIRTINEACSTIGAPIEIIIPEVDFPYTREQLDKIKARSSVNGVGAMCVLRPTHAIVQGKDLGGGAFEKIKVPITIRLLADTFRHTSPFVTGEKGDLFRIDSYELFLKSGSDSDTDPEQFFNEELTSGYFIQAQAPFRETLGHDYDVQAQFLMENERRRTAVEAVWDLMACLIHNGSRLLKDQSDWTSSRDLTKPYADYKVIVGFFNHEGIYINSLRDSEENIRNKIGLAPTWLAGKK